MPASRAPNAMDRPAVWVTAPAASTISSVRAAKISLLWVAATAFINGRRTMRPMPRMSMVTATALRTLRPTAWVISSGVPRRAGMRTSSGPTARSWVIRMPSAPRPNRECISRRSASRRSTIAVDDSDKAAPIATEAGPPSPTSMQIPASRAVVTSTCNPPSRNMVRGSWRRRSSGSSSPTVKSRKTMPSSARACGAWTSPIRSRKAGPMSSPAAR